MNVIATYDIPDDVLAQFSQDVPREISVEVPDSRRVLRSADPPSWIYFIETAPTWIMALGGLYIAELVREAAKETWKNRARAYAAIRAAGGGIAKLGHALAGLRGRVPARTSISIGLPLENDFDGALLPLNGSDPADLGLQVAVFVHHIPALQALFEEQEFARGGAATSVNLSIMADGSMKVEWQDGGTLERHGRILPIEPSDLTRRLI